MWLPGLKNIFDDHRRSAGTYNPAAAVTCESGQNSGVLIKEGKIEAGFLFQAVNQASHFKDLKIYYFHNCFYEYLFTTPSCSWKEKISTEWVLQNLKEEYKVILVGDGAMAPSELLYRGGSLDYFHSNEQTGLYWLERLKRRFPSAIWLNPIRRDHWEYTYGSYTITMIRERIPMFPLSAAGLEEGVKALKAGETLIM